MRVVYKEEKRVNRIDQRFIFLFLGGFKVIELHDVEQRVKAVTEVPQI